MPPTGFHGIFGLLGTFVIPKNHKSARIAFFFGTMAPDIDIFGSILIFLIGIFQNIPIDQLETNIINFHRSITHNIFVIIFLFNIGIILYLSKVDFRELSFIIIAFTVGITTHVALDFFYLDGVSVLWPLDPNRIFLFPDLPKITEMTDNFQKLFAASDSAFDGIYYIILGYILDRKFPENSIEFFNKKISNIGIKLQIFGLVTFLFFMAYGIFGFISEILPRNEFVVILYIPGMFILFITIFSPILLKKYIEVF
jgi:membrane-bound metal-dependent hydrolase YbcI (DUF457 family)